jgi:type IV pilus assembly protein PilC
MRRYFFLGVISTVFFVFILTRILKTEKGKYFFDRLKLRVPVFGPLLKKVAISKFTRTFSTLVKSGVPILSSLDIVGKTSGNLVVEKAVEKVKVNVRDGENIADPLARSGIFPTMVVRMISVGEKSGELEKMLSKVSEFYDAQVDAAVSGLTSMIEPLIIAFLGVVIGTIVICMFLPIFKLTEIVTF